MKLHNKLKIFLFSIILLLPFFKINVYADSLTKIDAVLVIDASNSMNSSDPSKISIEAMKMFIDMLSVNGDKVGIISYTDQIEREKALLTINDLKDKDTLKEFVSQLKRGKYTDISVGLAEAITVLDESNSPSHKPIIVVLSDGNNEVDTKKGKSYEEIENSVNASIEKAKQSKYPIYTIGLDANGNLNTEYLKSISDATEGKSFATKTANDLPNILSQIFADHQNLKVINDGEIVATGGQQNVTVNIPNNNVIEANITMLSDNPVQAHVFDPTGAEIKDSDKLIKTNSRTFTMIKLINPSMGDWTLKVKGVANDKIKINLIFNYDLTLEMDAAINSEYSVGSTINLSGYLAQGNQKITDDTIYKDTTCQIVVKDLDTQTEEIFDCTNNGNVFEGTFKVNDSHRYSVIMRAENKSFIRETTPVEFLGVAVTSQAPTTQATTQPPTTQATTNPPTTQAPTTQATIESQEDDVKNPFPILFIVIGVLILIVAIFFVYRLLKKSNKRLFGRIRYEILDRVTGSESSPQYKQLDAYGKSVTLYDLLAQNDEFRDAKLISMWQNSKASSSAPELVVKNFGAECKILKSATEIDASKGFTLRIRTKIIIVFEKINKQITIEYIE